MKITIHKSDSRGEADHGWLKARHSFSFASYHNPQRMGFGLLKVLNDDTIAPGAGFGTHPHKNMEIITVPINGSLKHKDSEGNEKVIQHGEVQLMSAGTGVSHSEYNGSQKEEINLLQIWVSPEKIGIQPRYDQKKFDVEKRKNQFQTIVSPIDSKEGGVKINQQAYFSLIDLECDRRVTYSLQNKKNGVYIFIIDGQAAIADTVLSQRDAIGIEESQNIDISSLEDSQILLLEVPMNS